MKTKQKKGEKYLNGFELFFAIEYLWFRKNSPMILISMNIKKGKQQVYNDMKIKNIFILLSK